MVPVQAGAAAGLAGAVDVLVRPEGLRIEAVPGGNGIVTDRAFLGVGEQDQRAACLAM